MTTIGSAAHEANTPLEHYHFERRDLRDEDVAIEDMRRVLTVLNG